MQFQFAGDAACDLGDFQRVCQAGAEQVAFVVDEYLGFVFQAAKCGGVDDAVTVALVFVAVGRVCFIKAPAD